MTFEQKLQSLSGKDVLKALIDGLENPVTDKVSMGDFGSVDWDICYGCGATNAICKIADVTQAVKYCTDRQINYREDVDYGSVSAKCGTIALFEDAIDDLRLGHPFLYNQIVRNMGYPNLILPMPEHILPALFDSNYKEDLHFYKEYYEAI